MLEAWCNTSRNYPTASGVLDTIFTGCCEHIVECCPSVLGGATQQERTEKEEQSCPSVDVFHRIAWRRAPCRRRAIFRGISRLCRPNDKRPLRHSASSRPPPK